MSYNELNLRTKYKIGWFLNMSEPQHPNTIIIQNQFYPDGLKEIDVWNYYQKNKNYLLKETLGRELIFFFSTDVNKTIVIRNVKGKILRLNPSNYDKVISGRTLSIHSCMKKIEDFFILDIDIDDINIAKDVVYETIPILEKSKFIYETKIRFTGKSSFHIVCYLTRKMYTDRAREIFESYLKESELKNIYDVGYRRRKGIPLLDLSIDKYRGGFITLGSLSVLGLKCLEVDRKHLKVFRKERAII